MQQVFCPEDVIKYHQNMGGADRGAYLREHGAAFSSKAYFKKVVQIRALIFVWFWSTKLIHCLEYEL